MKSIDARLRAIERRQKASKPISTMVLLPGQDAQARLAEFRRVHGREPLETFIIKRASMRKAD